MNLKYFLPYLFSTGMVYSIHKPYFYSGVSVSASLGTGSTLTSSKAGTFNSGNMQRARNGSVIPSSTSYGTFSGTGGAGSLNLRRQKSQESGMVEDERGFEHPPVAQALPGDINDIPGFSFSGNFTERYSPVAGVTFYKGTGLATMPINGVDVDLPCMLLRKKIETVSGGSRTISYKNYFSVASATESGGNLFVIENKKSLVSTPQPLTWNQPNSSYVGNVSMQLKKINPTLVNGALSGTIATTSHTVYAFVGKNASGFDGNLSFGADVPSPPSSSVINVPKIYEETSIFDSSAAIRYGSGTIELTGVEGIDSLPCQIEEHQIGYLPSTAYIVASGGKWPPASSSPTHLFTISPIMQTIPTQNDLPDVNTNGDFAGTCTVTEDDGLSKESYDLPIVGNAIEEPSSSTLLGSPMLGSASAPATPETQIIDFSQSVAQKNKSGIAYMFGLTGQYVTQSGMTLGLSINYGRTASVSSTDYAAGSLTGTSFTAADSIQFSTKDIGFVSELFQIGYAYQRFNPYLIFGIAQHRAKMFCPDAYQNTGGSITKGYNSPVFGIGLNVAVTKNVYLNVQWQRHMGGVKDWGNINEIIPSGRLAMGAPQSRLGNNMILFGVTYAANFKGK